MVGPSLNVTEYITSGYNSDGDNFSSSFRWENWKDSTNRYYLSEGRWSTIGDELHPEGSEEFDTESGANSLLSNPDYALISSKCLAYGGDALKQSNKHFIRAIPQDTYDVSALLLLISVADPTAESKLYPRLARYALLL